MKRKKSIKAITMIELGLAGVLLVVLALFVYWYADGLSSYSPNAQTYQILGGESFNYSENVTFREREDGGKVEDDNGSRELIESPILYEGSTQMTIPCNMLLMNPLDNIGLRRINRFTTVSERGGLITFTSDKKTAEVHGGFLYNGKDLYIFLEDTVLNISGDEVRLPAMSYAVVPYCQYIEYFNSETKEDKVIYIDEMNITAKSVSGYKLDIGRDIIYKGDQEALLYSSVDNIDVIEMD